MIRVRVRLDDSDPQRPSAWFHAYREDEPWRADDPAIPDFLSDHSVEPDVISSVATDMPDEADAPIEQAEDEGGESADDDGMETNVWAAGVVITTERPIAGYNGLPFCYEIIQPGRADSAAGSAQVRDPIIRVVAAAGVRVLLVPPASDAEPIVRVDVIRVQDPNTVPSLGESINASMMLAGNGVGLHRFGWALDYLDLYSSMHMARFAATDDDRIVEADELMRMVHGPRRISVIPQRNGTLFFDNLSERMLQVRVRPRAAVWGGADDRADVDARYGYSINQNAGRAEVALTLAATAAVEVSQFFFGAFEAGESVEPDIADEQRDMQPFVLLRVPNFDAVPLPGQAVEAPSAPTAVMAGAATMAGRATRFHPWATTDIPIVEPPVSLRDTLTHAALDVGISLIPVVGDILDIFELGTALVSGRDRWGQRVGTIDLVMMGLGAITPFVNRRELQITLFVGQAGLGGAVILPAYLESEDEEAASP